LLFVTGDPGIGKSSVLLKVIQSLKAEGYSVGGMLSREVRSEGKRVGFEVLDVNNHRRGWLARIDQDFGPRLGRYYVNLKDLENVGAKAITNAVEELDVVLVDEVGPMELYSESFRKSIDLILKCRKLVVGSIHWKMKNDLLREIRLRKDCEIFRVTVENRRSIHRKIIQKALEYLSHHEQRKTQRRIELLGLRFLA
jgi:nucleoside-triphosphatase